VGTEPVDYCREIETYLCRKNDGHLIRVVGPSFELVSRWEADSIPLNIAYAGIDRYFERYYRKGPRRRPVRIDFCDADVRDVFDEWRRAVGLTHGGAAATGETAEHPTTSLPAHLERASLQLTTAAATASLGPAIETVLDALSHELDAARSAARGLRGDARRAMIDRLAALDRELVQLARAALSDEMLQGCEREADGELAAFRDRMPPADFQRARDRAIDRLARERLRLPTLTYG
jgi:hypothetical protein